jgi:hypothetical protein
MVYETTQTVEKKPERSLNFRSGRCGVWGDVNNRHRNFLRKVGNLSFGFAE